MLIFRRKAKTGVGAILQYKNGLNGLQICEWQNKKITWALQVNGKRRDYIIVWLYILGTSFEYRTHMIPPEVNCSLLGHTLTYEMREWLAFGHSCSILISTTCTDNTKSTGYALILLTIHQQLDQNQRCPGRGGLFSWMVPLYVLAAGQLLYLQISNIRRTLVGINLLITQM